MLLDELTIERDKGFALLEFTGKSGGEKGSDKVF